jgi:hypothetical protein
LLTLELGRYEDSDAEDGAPAADSDDDEEDEEEEDEDAEEANRKAEAGMCIFHYSSPLSHHCFIKFQEVLTLF